MQRSLSVLGGIVGTAVVAGCGNFSVSLGPGSEGAEEVSTLTWREVARGPQSRSQAMGVMVGNRLFVLGGYVRGGMDVTDAMHAYDPELDLWTALAPLPGAQVHAGTAAYNGRIYVAGGIRGYPGAITSEGWWYQPDLDSWSALPSLPVPRAALALVVMDGKLHAMGGMTDEGRSSSADMNVLSVAGGPAAAWTLGEAFPNPRSFLGGVAVGHSLYVVGGRKAWDEVTGQTPDLNEYDTPERTWASRTEMPTARSEIASSTLSVGGKVLVVGGSTANARPSDRVDEYNPHTGTWRTLGKLPVALQGTVAGLWEDKLIVTTGSTETEPDTARTWVGCCVVR